jgi:catechol 2,3-dioxygenase-like lactoylglutathione lyase family enzyme
MALNMAGDLTCALGVTDIQQSIDWYQSVLGMELMYHSKDIAWCELSSGVSKVSVGLGQVETVKPGGATLVWGVDDIDAAKAHLDALAIPQDGPIEHIPGLVKLLSFNDPDGNALKFSQSLVAE